MILVGVDPGNVTGIAVWWDPRVYVPPDARGPLDTAEVEAAAVPAVLRRMLDGERPTLIAVERYKQNARKTHQPEAYHVTGVVRSLCEDLMVRCVYQSPSPAQKIGSVQRLKQLGWYVKSKDGHANAASGHVLLAMATYWSETYANLIGL